MPKATKRKPKKAKDLNGRSMSRVYMVGHVDTDCCIFNLSDIHEVFPGLPVKDLAEGDGPCVESVVSEENYRDARTKLIRQGAFVNVLEVEVPQTEQGYTRALGKTYLLPRVPACGSHMEIPFKGYEDILKAIVLTAESAKMLDKAERALGLSSDEIVREAEAIE
jgi:hypothetical protein